MKYLLFSLFYLIPLFALAQHDIIGKITDDKDESLMGATVVLLSSEDSLMIAFALTDEKGNFRLVDIEEANYILQVSFISHESYSQALITDWKTKNILIAMIRLAESSAVLQEITINAEHIPMGIRGDTISYNAAAFKTRTNASVEELLKKLPGIEVERNGEIKAQGETVKNVLVDGKEFFNGNPTMATKNLQAEAVDKVEVFDKQSDIAEFTGITDGKEEKTINLKLKEDHKNGGFGNVNLAGGTEDSYDGKINYFRFSPKLQASVILAANNINEETFSIGDRIELMGGIGNIISSGGLITMDSEGLKDGLNKSNSLGSNFNYDINSKLKLNSHYMYNRIENDLDQVSDLEGITGRFNYHNLDSLNSNQINALHQLNTKLNYKLSPFTEFVFQNNINFKNRSDLQASNKQYLKEGISLGLSNSDFSSSSALWGFDSRTTYRQKFIKTGRSIVSNFLIKRDRESKDDQIDLFNGIGGNTMNLNQNQIYSSINNVLGMSANLTEAISSNIFVGLNYNFSRSHEQPERLYYDIVGQNEILNKNLSTQYNKTYFFQRTGLSIRRNTKKLKMNFALDGQWTKIEGLISGTENKIEGNYFNFLPLFGLEYEMKGNKSLNFDYNTSVIAPQLDQLAPLEDNTSANFKFIGNPMLNPQYDRLFSIHFNLFDNFNFTNLFTNIRYTKSQDRIVYKTSVDENLFQTVEPINSRSYQELTSYISFSKPFRPLKLKYNIRSRARYANYESFINNLSSEVTESNLNLRLAVSNRNTDHVSIEAGIEFDFNHRKYGISPDFNQSYQNSQYFIDAEFYIPGGLTIASELNYNNYSSGYFSAVPTYYLWSASVRKLLFEDKLEINIRAFDILNQNLGYRRSGDSQSLRQVEFKTLGRFFMVGFNYKIGRGGNEDDGIRIEMH